MFHFSTANGYSGCYPTWPFNSDGSQVPAAGLNNWPIIKGCRKPDAGGLPKKNWGPKMPVYYQVKICPNRSGRGDDSKELRVFYGLFYEKDGFNPSGGNGHQ